MTISRCMLVASAACLLTLASPSHLVGQITRADSAEILLTSAQQLDARGERALARGLLRFVATQYSDTPAGLNAAELLRTLDAVRVRGSGRTGLIVWNTIYGAWLGIAIPAAVGADSPEPFGAGLLIGAPLGFFGSKAIANRYGMSSGQATTAAFGSWWGTWQGIGWREVLDIGSEKFTQCFDTPQGQICETFESDPDEAPWTAAVVGGVAGLVASGAIASVKRPSAGAATMVQFGALWGTWYGLASGVLAQAEDDGLFAWTLIGGNVGLLAAAVATRWWDLDAGQAWLISAAGLAGGLAGVGVALLLDVEDEETGVAIPSVTAAAGLVTGALLTRRTRLGRLGGPPLGDGTALVQVKEGQWSIGVPLPLPTLLRDRHQGQTRPALGFRIPLLSGEF